MNILIGITGSIAAYKTLELIRERKKRGDDVKVILTSSSQHFVTPLCCQTLTGNEVYFEQFVLTRGIKHLTLAQWADILVIAPATANILGKAACGIADDLLSTTIVSFPKPILFVPAMDTGMWENLIVQQNVQRLRSAGYYVLEPFYGSLASGKKGRGRFPAIQLVDRTVDTIIARYPSLRGRHILISGGRTEEDIDSVRVVTNRSSGTMARELLYAVLARDGHARCVMGQTTVAIPDTMGVIRVRTAQEMLRELTRHISWCDCLVMAAAVGDYRPEKRALNKVHDHTYTLDMKKNKDILKALRAEKEQRFFIGFSLEDKNTLAQGRKKLKEKGLDLIVLNGKATIGQERVKAQLLFPGGRTKSLGLISKFDCAHAILNAYLARTAAKSKK